MKMIELAVLFSAIVIDRLIGDPVYQFHPVRLMGKLISINESILFKVGLSGYFGGFLLLTTVSGISIFCALSAYHFANNWFPPAGIFVCIFFLYSVIGLRDLFDHAAPVQKSLQDNHLNDARKYVQRFIGRDAGHLNSAGIVRAAVESVAENFVDGFLSVVFWFVCGWLFASLFGWPPLQFAVGGAIFYRAVNTLDAMTGYINDRYRKFGFISAKTDDFLNFVPARISVQVIITAAFLCGYDAKNGFRIAMRDRKKHASPNSGHPESAIAGILNVRLGGPCIYPYGCVDKPWLGENDIEITPDHIHDVCRIIQCAALISLAAAMAMIVIFDLLID